MDSLGKRSEKACGEINFFYEFFPFPIKGNIKIKIHQESERSAGKRRELFLSQEMLDPGGQCGLVARASLDVVEIAGLVDEDHGRYAADAVLFEHLTLVGEGDRAFQGVALDETLD